MRAALALQLLRLGGWLLNKAARPAGMGVTAVLIFDAEDGLDVIEITRKYGECREVAA